MAEEITINLVYLTEKLTNLQTVLDHCLQNKIITIDDEERILGEITSLEKNRRFFRALMKRDWEEIRPTIIKIFRETSNGHCADKIDNKKTPAHPKTSSQIELDDSHNQQSNSEERKTKQVIASKWWPNIKTLPKAFFERKEYDYKLIDVLKENLKNSKNNSTVVSQGTAVSGMGGVGKTTTAKWFAIHFQDCYDHIIWIDCGEESLSSSFKELSSKLKIDTNLKLEALAKECFSMLEEARCLFIFDNAECYQGPQGIRDVLPKHDNFHTIITSRKKEWGSESGDGKIPEMILTGFETSESVEFLKKNLKNTFYIDDQIKKLSTLLGNLPLALQIAVTTINTKELSLSEYIERIVQSEHIINQNFDGYEKTINKTMKISLDIIKSHENDPNQTAYKILLILGYTKPDMVDFKLFQIIENLKGCEIKEAMELLEKYSLITTGSQWDDLTKEWTEWCSIHRLLQQVIRHNNKENEKATINRILSIEGFLDYKFFPYFYADEETRIRFPDVRAQLFEQYMLGKLLEERKFSEAVELSRKIRDTLETPSAEYNYAMCLEKMDELKSADTVFNVLHNYLLTKKQIDEHPLFNDKDNIMIYGMVKMVFHVMGNKNGLCDLKIPIEPALARGLLFLIYNRLKNYDSVNEILNHDCEFLSHSVEYVIESLKNSSISKYQLINDGVIEILRGGYSGKVLSLKNCSLCEEFPNDLDDLSLENVKMLNGENGDPIAYCDISTLISTRLKSLTIKCAESTKFAIEISEKICQSCRFITLDNCIILLQNGSTIFPTEIDLQRVTFMQNGEEIEIVCLNDFIDFQQTKKLTLKGSNMSMKLDESLSINQISLHEYSNLEWKDFNCTVRNLFIKNTNIPPLDQSIGLRVNTLILQNCSAHLTSLFFLSQNVHNIILNEVTIAVDEQCISGNVRIYADDVKLENITVVKGPLFSTTCGQSESLSQPDSDLNSREKIAKIDLHKILDLSKIKTLSVLGGQDTVMTFNFNQQVSMDLLRLKRVNVRWSNESKINIKTLDLSGLKLVRETDSSGHELPNVLSFYFKDMETLQIRNSSVDVNFLENVSVDKLGLYGTSIIDKKVDVNDSASKCHHINDQVKQIEFIEITFFREENIINFPVNEFVNISQLRSLSLALTTNTSETCSTLDFENILLSLDTLKLQNVTILNWEKGNGYVNKMKMWDIPFEKRNNIKIKSLEFGRSTNRYSLIDLSCLPKNIQRIQLIKGNNVTCKGQITFKDLNCVLIHGDHSTLQYFSSCPNLHKVELKYYDKIEEKDDFDYDDYNPLDEEFLVNLQWIPKSVKILKLVFPQYHYFPTLNVVREGSSLQLETVIFDNILLSNIESALQLLSPENIIVNIPYMSVTKVQADFTIQLIESYKSVAIGKCQWENDDHFQSCALSKFTNEKGEYYVFENKRGKALQKTEFQEILNF